MANDKTSDYAALPGGLIQPTWLLDIANPSIINYKGTQEEERTFINSGKAGGKKIEGGTAASENLILDSTSDATKGEVQIADGSTLYSNTTNYETLVTNDNDFPNKKYVDTHSANNMWTRTGTLIGLTNAGDTLNLGTGKGIYLSQSGILDIVAATGIPNVDDDIIYIRSSTAGDTTITANPQIVVPPDSASKKVIFIGTDNTKTVTFVYGNGIATKNGQPFTLGLNDVFVVVYSTVNSTWVELYRSDNN
jgi:hypothetical protein